MSVRSVPLPVEDASVRKKPKLATKMLATKIDNAVAWAKDVVAEKVKRLST